jgi:hypothetical protein
MNLSRQICVQNIQWQLRTEGFACDTKKSRKFLSERRVAVASGCALTSKSKRQSHLTTNGESATLSRCQATISDPWPIFLFLFLDIFFRSLRVSYNGAPSLMRGPICNLQLLLGLVSAAFHGSEFRGTHDQILCSQIWDSPNLESQVPVFFTPKEQVDHYTPRHRLAPTYSLSSI